MSTFSILMTLSNIESVENTGERLVWRGADNVIKSVSTKQNSIWVYNANAYGPEEGPTIIANQDDLITFLEANKPAFLTEEDKDCWYLITNREFNKNFMALV